MKRAAEAARLAVLLAVLVAVGWLAVVLIGMP